MNDGKHVPDSMMGIACEEIGRNRKRLEVRRLKKVVGISTGIVLLAAGGFAWFKRKH